MKTMPYKLELQIPENDSQEIIVQDVITLGSDPSNDICLQDFGLAPKHCIFRLQQEVLTVFNIGGSKPLQIGKQKLDLGKTYILDHGDEIHFGELAIGVFEVENKIEDDEEIPPPPPLSLGTPASQLEPESDEQQMITPAAEPTSLNIAELIEKAKAQSEPASDKAPRRQKKKVKEKSRENTHWDELNVLDETETKDSNKTFSKLLYLTSKLKKVLTQRPLRDRQVKAEPIKKIVTGPPKIKIDRSENIPGFIPRFFAFAFNITLAGLVAQTIFDVPSAVIVFTELLEKFHYALSLMPEISFLNEVIRLFTPQFLAAVIVYYFLEFIFSLLLGRSLGYTLLGIYESSGFITSRIKALIRTFFGLITFPFIIFDAPSFFRRRSFKEVLSFSHLEFKRNFIGYLTTLVLLPALLMVFLLADAFNKKDMILTWQYQEITPLKRSESERPISFLGISLPWNEDWSNSLIPSVTPKHLAEHYSEKERAPKVGLTLLAQGAKASLYPGPQYSAKDWFEVFNSKNLPARLLNPSWQDFIELSTAPGPVAQEIKDQMRLLFLAGFTDYLADPLNLIEYVRVFGPYLPPIESWRNSFINESSLKRGDQLRWVRNTNRDLLIKQYEKDDSIIIEHYFLDRTPFQSLLLVGDKKDRAFLVEMSQRFIQQARPLALGTTGTSVQDETIAPLELTNLLSQWMDHLLKNKRSPAPEKLDDLYELFFQLAGETLGLAEDDPKRRLLDLEISRFSTIVDQSEVTEESFVLKGQLLKLFEAYQEQTSSFFVRESYNALDNIK